MIAIKHLIPESVLVSSSDEIPGLFEAWEDRKFQGKDMVAMERAEEI